MAEATAGQPEGEAHLREALQAADDDDVRLGAALVLAHVLGRREQIAQAIEVIDLAAARLADNRGRARVLLESMATGAGMLDAATAPRLASRMRAMRRAADHAHVPREVLAVAALVAVHANEPAPTCIALAQRALAAGPADRPRADRPAVVRPGDGRARVGRRARPRRRSPSTPAWPRAARRAIPPSSA